jgi:hypothetical protein
VAPTVIVSGHTLTWHRVANINTYVIVSKVPGQAAQTRIVRGPPRVRSSTISSTPPAVPGATVSYTIRTTVRSSAWSREVSITYASVGEASDPRAAPLLGVSGDPLSWSAVAHIGTYVLATKVADSEETFTAVSGTSITPPLRPGKTVRYRVRTAAVGSAWSAEVAISYPAAPPSAEIPGAGASPPEAPAGTSEPLRLFSALSVFNKPLPAAPPLAADSAQLVDAFNEQVQKYGGHVVINTTEWSAPDYVVGPNASTIALVGESSICLRPEGVFSGFQAQIEAVPIPANAVPAAGSDKDMIVWQPSTGHLWELWRALEESGHWTACWGGEIPDAYTGDGLFAAPFGVSAAGLSILAGQIHIEDLEHGAINHALEVLLPDTASSFVWPADKTDGTSTDADSIPEGTRFRLDPNLDLSSLKLSPAAGGGGGARRARPGRGGGRGRARSRPRSSATG